MSDPDSLENLELLQGDERIVAEAKYRFRKCEDWEATAHVRFIDDYKFANADADNGYQWPNKIFNERNISQRPTLTVNKTRQHCLQIINDARQNKPSVNIRPTGGKATYEAAQVFEGIIRHIEYISNAESAYDRATAFQVQAGWGYWRVVTDYANDDTFDQEIFIRPIKDPLGVYLDPDINEFDGSDARYGFVFDDVPRDQFELEYPEHKDQVGKSALGNDDGWIDKHHVRVAEYYRLVEKTDKLLAIRDESTGQMMERRASELPPEVVAEIEADPEHKSRKISTPRLEWFKIAGDTIIDRTKPPGRYVPIVRVIGEETIIEGRLDRKGHTRALIDPQRMYNYWTSSAVEFVALQGKSPFVGAARAIEGYETYWETANNVNHSILPYNDKSDDGQTIPPPERSQPPVMAQAYIDGMKIAAGELMMASGQYEATMGQKSNEVSGKAINERQRQGETSTYHFIDNLASAIRFTGKILIDLIPQVYDTPRVIRILAEDGEESEVNLDPNAKQAYVEQKVQEDEAVRAIFNPTVGKYDVESDIGPGYATKRQEAWNAFTQIAAQDPALMGVIGDLMFRNADFPGADEIAERLERMVPPQAKGEGPPPALAQATQQLAHQQVIIQKLIEQLDEEKQKLKNREEQKDIDVYKALTDRLKVLLPTIVNPAEIARMVHEFALQEHQAQLTQVTAANALDLERDAAQGQTTQEAA